MTIKIVDKIKPAGDFKAVDAVDVQEDSTHRFVSDAQMNALPTTPPVSSIVDKDGTATTGITKLQFHGATIEPPDQAGGPYVVSYPASTSGITVDTASVNVVGATTLSFFENVEADTAPDDPKKVLLKPVLDVSNRFDSNGGVRATSIKVGPSLEVFPETDIHGAITPDSGIIDIVPGTFERRQAEGFLAYMEESEDLANWRTDNTERGRIWFGDIIVGDGNMFIAVDRPNKAWGLQEDDNKDPNITGGTAYLIAVQLAFRGTAGSDGWVKMQLVVNNPLAVGSMPADGTPILDENGQQYAVKKNIKTDEEIGKLFFAGITKFKSETFFRLEVTSNLSNDVLEIMDRTEGPSGILLQAIHTNEKTGRALIQFEEDTGYNLEFSSHYLGPDIATAVGLTVKDDPLQEGNAGTALTLEDGWGVYNTTPLKIGVVNNRIQIQDNGTDLCYFNFHKIFSAEKTKMLLGKELDVSIIIEDKQSAFRVYMAKWTGEPDKYTKDIITDIINDTPTVAPNWELAPDSIFISEDVLSGEHTLTGTLTVPSDAKNFAVLIAPIEKVSPLLLKLKDMPISVHEPFTGYVVHHPTIVGEEHLVISKEYKQFGVDLPTTSIAGFRYTINQNQTLLPSGNLIKGNADVSSVGYDPLAQGGEEGVLKFGVNGTAQIRTIFRIHVGESVPDGGSSTTKFYWAIKTAPNTYSKISDSETSITLHKSDQDYQFISTPEFTLQAEKDMEIICIAESTVNDGAYLESNAQKQYLINTVINFEETKFQSVYNDDPDVGVDLSGASKVAYSMTIADYPFINKNFVTIPMDIPLDTEVVVLGVYYIDSNGQIRDSNNVDYLYEPVAKEFRFAFGTITSGKIVLGFYV
jgi:hypothetical protein